MTDFYEIDFHRVESNKSGDAITIRYQFNGTSTIHVVDGGYQDTGNTLIKHMATFYDKPRFIDHVVVTHNDGDHAGGLRRILEEYEIGKLWMLRPWEYAEELLPRFSRFTNADNLRRRLREIYSNLAALEDLANENGILIQEPLQGSQIGVFTVLAPSIDRFKDLVVASEKTPDAIDEATTKSLISTTMAKALRFVRSLWGDENFSDEETTAENEMSVVQYSYLLKERILLTGDAGRGALSEARDYLQLRGVPLPGIDVFQVPHHGSRRNLSSDLLDDWVGPKLAKPVEAGKHKFKAMISASKGDPDHPRKAVVRAMKHRGAKVMSTEEFAWTRLPGGAAPTREGSQPATDLPYPEDQEE